MRTVLTVYNIEQENPAVHTVAETIIVLCGENSIPVYTDHSQPKVAGGLFVAS